MLSPIRTAVGSPEYFKWFLHSYLEHINKTNGKGEAWINFSQPFVAGDIGGNSNEREIKISNFVRKRIEQGLEEIKTDKFK